MIDAPIKALAPWYGAKRKAAIRSKIIDLLGRPRFFCEPFCGSCAVSLAVPFTASTHIVNDLHMDLINLARCLVDRYADLSSLVGNMVFCEDLFWDRVAMIQAIDAVQIPDPARAAAYVYVSWCGANGFGGTVQDRDQPRFAKRFNASGGDGAKRWRSVLKSIPAWRERMATWTILNLDAGLVIDKIKDAGDAGIYVDSPYHPEARSSAKYVHDFEAGCGMFAGDDDQHARLEQRLRRFNHARVVVSHYDCVSIRDLYTPDRGWKIIDCPMTKNIANASGKPAEAPEILIVN